MLTEIGGTFVKIALAGDAHLSLARGDPARPAARFNRRGQDALYLSPDEESARVAIGQYVRAGDAERVLLTFRVGTCRLFDLRGQNASDVCEMARQPWMSAVAAGAVPASWQAADDLRARGHAGLIDPSRRRPGLWHITLFRWNEEGAPSVRTVGDPVPISVGPGFR